MEKIYSRNKYSVSWKTHSKHVFKSLCCLMEHQSLVDIAICCGNRTLHAHKCILAANSHYFKEEMERNSTVEQIIITGFDFSVLKAIIEFMYCGETIINEENVKYLIAAAKLLQIRGLDTLFSDRQEYQHLVDDVYIPYPQFISSKPKYPVAFHAPHNPSISNGTSLKMSNYSINDPFNKKKLKRKYLRSEAEKACAKEAHASRMALAHLQKEIASTSQVNSFIIEESCTETTVENFIPHADENCLQETKAIQPVQLIDYSESEPSFSCDSTVGTSKQNLFGTIPNAQDMATDKLKNIFGSENPSNIEIIFKTNDGNFVTVNDEVLQNLSKGGLQYQIVDENGHVGEIHDFKLMERATNEKIETQENMDMLKDFMRSTKLPADEREMNISGQMTNSEGCVSEFKSSDCSLSTNSQDMDDRKPIQFMLLDNGEFETGMMGSFSQAIKICDEKDSSNVTSDMTEDFVNFADVVDDENSMTFDKSSIKFSPDIFFADSSSNNMGDKKLLTLKKN